MKHYSIITLLLSGAVLLFPACSDGNNGEEPEAEATTLKITSSIVPFGGDSEQSRVNLEGNAFTTGDLMRMKIICPYTAGAELGESSYGNTYDSFWLMKWNGTAWKPLVTADGFDVNGDSRPSGSSDITGHFESQQTPYVYTASTWAVERRFFDKDSRLQLQYTPVFYADQSIETNYRLSDILWAQTFMQTGTSRVHLEFRHVMSALLISLDGNTAAISAEATLMVEGVPDIDQAEIVVGDYYAAKSKINASYGYRDKSSCSAENNGKVLGVGVNDDATKKARALPMRGNPGWESGTCVANTGTYTAYNAGGYTYRVMMPPCSLENEATMVLRSGDKRYKAKLSQKDFAEGTLYKVTFTIKNDEPITTP